MGGHDVETKNAREAGDEERDSNAAAEVAADVRAQRETAERQGNEAPDLTEYGAGTVSDDVG